MSGLHRELDVEVEVHRDSHGRPTGLSMRLDPAHPYSELDLSEASTAFLMCLLPDPQPEGVRSLAKLRPPKQEEPKLTLDDFRR